METTKRDPQRDIAVLQMFIAGDTNVVIGRKLGLTRERVRQLLKRLGVQRYYAKSLRGYYRKRTQTTQENGNGCEGHA